MVPLLIAVPQLLDLFCEVSNRVARGAQTPDYQARVSLPLQLQVSSMPFALINNSQPFIRECSQHAVVSSDKDCF